MNWTVWVAESESVSLANIPHQLGVALGTSDFVGGIIGSALFMMLLIIPVLYFTKGKNFLLAIIVGYVGMGLSVALSWFPAWMMLLLLIFTAALWASGFSNWITGKGG